MARVFLCDDSEGFRLLARLNLEARGHEVVGESGDPEECAAGLAATVPDVALVDGFLPESITLASLRAGSPATLLVLYSGLPQVALDQEAAHCGADGAISKSASFDEVAALLGALAGP